MSSVESSPARGMSDADGTRMWPFDSKNARYPSRSSALVRMASIVGRTLGPVGSGDFVGQLLLALDCRVSRCRHGVVEVTAGHE